MLRKIMDCLGERGQGVVEYALILCFVGALAYAVFGGGPTFLKEISNAASNGSADIGDAASNVVDMSSGRNN